MFHAKFQDHQNSGKDKNLNRTEKRLSSISTSKGKLNQRHLYVEKSLRTVDCIQLFKRYLAKFTVYNKLRFLMARDSCKQSVYFIWPLTVDFSHFNVLWPVTLYCN